MPGKQTRALCPVCQEAMPPDETECRNCGAFVIDEAVVRLCRALGIDREKALHLFEAGFRHPRQLADRDVDGVLQRRESGLLFLCTNCGSFVAGGDARCARCGAEFEAGLEEEPAWRGAEEDILDLSICPNCGADNGPEWAECEICGEPLRASPQGTPSGAAVPSPDRGREEDELDAMLEELEGAMEPSSPPARPTKPASADGTAPSPSPPTLTAPPAPRPSGPERPPAPAVPSPPSPVPSDVGRPASREPPRRPEPPPLRRVPPPEVPRRVPPREGTAPVRQVRRPAEIRVRTPPPRASRRASPSTLQVLLGPSVVAGGIALYAGQAMGQGWTAWGIAFVLAAVTGYALAGSRPASLRRLRAADGLLLAAGIVAGTLAPILGVLASLDSVGTGLAVASALPLAAATRRLLGTRARDLLAAAAAIPLVVLGIAAGEATAYAGGPAWTIGILAALPWPGALTAVVVRERFLSAAVRREIVEAERHMDREEYARSVEEYDRAIRLTEKGSARDDLPWYGKGAALVILGRYGEALEAIDRALDINPQNEVAWVNKGNALTKMGRVTEALRCFNAAIKVNPGYEVAWNNKGNALARLGRHEEALRCYEKALDLDPDYRGAWVNKGYVLAKLGRYEEAAACADRVLRLPGPRRPGPA